MESPTTYTTIPISGNAVISRSLDNLTTTLYRTRPWSEFFSFKEFNRPDSLSAAGDRLRLNYAYFSLNYAIIALSCALFSLITTPLSFFLTAAVLFLWLVFYFFREDPLVVRNFRVDDWAVLVGLVAVSLVAIWFTGIGENLIVGIVTGVAFSAVHGVFRNPDGLFLDENEAASRGLIGSGSDFDRRNGVC